MVTPIPVLVNHITLVLALATILNKDALTGAYYSVNCTVQNGVVLFLFSKRMQIRDENETSHD